MPDKKIIIYGKHFASINEILYNKLKEFSNVENMTQFIKGNVLADFGINIKGSEDIEALDKVLAYHYYDSKKEWLNNKLRTIVFQYESSKLQKNPVISYFYEIPGTNEYNSSKVLTKSFIKSFIKEKAMLKRSEKNYLNIMKCGTVEDILTTPLISFEYFLYNDDYMTDKEVILIYECLLEMNYEEYIGRLPNYEKRAMKIKENTTMRDKLIEKIISEEWTGELSHLVTAVEVKTDEDVKKMQSKGYTSAMKYETLEGLLQGVDMSKIHFDKNGTPARTVYFDKENLILLQLFIGKNPNGELTILFNGDSIHDFIEEFIFVQKEALDKQDFNSFILATPRAYRKEIVQALGLKYPEVTVERYQDAIHFD